MRCGGYGCADYTRRCGREEGVRLRTGPSRADDSIVVLRVGKTNSNAVGGSLASGSGR